MSVKKGLSKIIKKSTYFKWAYRLSGNEHRVTTLF